MSRDHSGSEAAGLRARVKKGEELPYSVMRRVCYGIRALDIRAPRGMCVVLWKTTSAGPAWGGIRFAMPARKGQPAREVRQQVWAKRVRLRDGQGAVLEATRLVARELGAPAGVPPIEWRLLTNRVVGTFEQAVDLIEWYRARREIEVFFHVLKNGCRVEALQLAAVQRLERALALFMVVAGRIAHLMRLGRTYPDLQAELLFEGAEWKAAFILNKKPVPKTPPRLNEVVRLAAKLGGFLGRKGDGEPGVKTIWLGLQRVMDFAAGLRYANGVHAL